MTDANDVNEFDRDDELRALLRAADPAASLSPADPSRVARLLEDTMSFDVDTEVANESRQTGTHGRNPLTWLVGAAAVTLIAGVGIFGFLNHDSGSGTPSARDTSGATSAPAGDPTVTELSLTAFAGKCMVPNAETLASNSLAFQGTVQSIENGVVTLAPSQFYTGSETDLVQVDAPDPDMVGLVGAVDFKVGDTYLLSASGGHVTVCGFSGEVTPELTQLYSSAFAH